MYYIFVCFLAVCATKVAISPLMLYTGTTDDLRRALIDFESKVKEREQKLKEVRLVCIQRSLPPISPSEYFAVFWSLKVINPWILLLLQSGVFHVCFIFGSFAF